MEVQLPNIKVFENVTPSKAQALKILEEASEVVSAFKDLAELVRIVGAKMDEIEEEDRPKYIEALARLEGRVVEECSDVIQATVNLVYALRDKDTEANLQEGIEFITAKNEKRGYYGAGEDQQ